ncbi:MAG: resolvase [Lachnospiraceae bacterium]|nr:resolvase [Lachnospiraceae bacterium]
MISTLEEALKRIAELEDENAKLKAEIENYKGRKFAGRQKHDAIWMESYNDFAFKYEGGMTIMEIVAEGRISRRTAYRYKAYYDELSKLMQ